jgi:hypothetical protein
MRLCLPARMGGGGKAESTPWRGPAGAQRPPHGGAILLWEREGKALGVPTQSKERRRQPSPAATRHRNDALARRDADGRRDCKPKRTTRPLRAKRSAASRSERASVARPARREARAPAGQHKNAAPLGAHSAGLSASLDHPAQLTVALLPICSRSSPEWAGTTGPVRAADRAGCPQGSACPRISL